MYSLTVHKSEIKVSAGLVPSEDYEEEFVPCSSSSFCGVLAILGVPCLVDLCLHLNMEVSMCVPVCAHIYVHGQIFPFL